MEESMLLMKGGHWAWSRTSWSQGWSGWAMPLLIDVSDDEVGEEGQEWGGLSTVARMVRGEGDGLEPQWSSFEDLLSLHGGLLSRLSMRHAVWGGGTWHSYQWVGWEGWEGLWVLVWGWVGCDHRVAAVHWCATAYCSGRHGPGGRQPCPLQ